MPARPPLNSLLAGCSQIALCEKAANLDDMCWCIHILRSCCSKTSDLYVGRHRSCRPIYPEQLISDAKKIVAWGSVAVTPGLGLFGR